MTTLIAEIEKTERKYPFYLNLIPAGFPSAAQDHCEGRVSLDEIMGIRTPQVYLARASGSSMEGVGIFDNDLLVIDRSCRPVSGQVVIAAVNGEPLVKTFISIAGAVVLRSNNPKFPDYELREGDDFQVWGVVTHSIRRHG